MEWLILFIIIYAVIGLVPLIITTIADRIIFKVKIKGLNILTLIICFILNSFIYNFIKDETLLIAMAVFIVNCIYIYICSPFNYLKRVLFTQITVLISVFTSVYLITLFESVSLFLPIALIIGVVLSNILKNVL